jgi:HK97 family phage portal protein
VSEEEAKVVGIFDWLGPTSLTKRRGWDALPAPRAEGRGAGGEEKAVGQPYPRPLMGVGSPTFYPTSLTTLLSNSTAPATLAQNSAVAACLAAIATAVAEPELRVYRSTPGERIELDATPLGDLLARPNPRFSMDTLLAYVAVSLHVDGNGYWRKLRAGNPERGNVVELWPVAPGAIEPITNGGSDDFISYYRYTESGGRTEQLSVQNVVHFRYGIDDADHRLGSSPLRRLIREISSDDQATRYADRLLANLAINGLSLSFDKEAPPIDQATADELKARIIAAYGGDNVGATAVLSPGATLTAIGFSPEQLDMKTLHRVPEERISAVLGVPAIVAGLGAGLDRATYANVREAREMFTEQKLIPLWRSMAAEITLQLVPDFSNDAATLVDFDTDQVRALGDDQNALAERLKVLVETGILTIDEARAELGYDAMPRSTVAEPEAPPEEEEEEEEPAVPAPIRAAAARRVRALPSERKAAEDLPARYGDLRELSLPTWEAELIAFFEAQSRRVSARLRQGADRADELVVEGEAVLLGETLTPLQLRTLDAVSRLVVAELGVAFDLDDPATREFLRVAGGNIVGITETTRTAVQAALIEGQAAGEGIEPLARRLRDLPAFGSARGRVVARTELGTSQNTAAIASYRASEVVVGVRVHDGDFDAACQAMNGRTFPLDQVPPALQHPNCVRAFSPVVDSAELVSPQRSASGVA